MDHADDAQAAPAEGDAAAAETTAPAAGVLHARGVEGGVVVVVHPGSVRCTDCVGTILPNRGVS
jgi:hypothetical protein